MLSKQEGALRNYLTNLHTELSDKGIFVGHRALALFITEPGTGTAGDPDAIADMWNQAYSEKKVWEYIVIIQMLV